MLSARTSNVAIRWLGFALGVAVIWAVAHFVGLNGAALHDALRHERLNRFALACSVFFINLLLNSFAYVQLIRATGNVTPTARLVVAYGSSVLAKYAPAPLLQIAGRSVALARSGVATTTVVTTSLIEQVISLGLCFALGYFLRWPASRPAILIAAVVGVFSLLAAWRYVPLRRWPNRLRLSVPRVLLSIALYLVALAVFVLGYWLLVADVVSVQAPEFGGSLLLGTSAGLAAIFVPGGLGVREGVTTALASSSKPDFLAALLVARVALFVAELVAGAICVGILLLRRRVA